MVVSEKMSFENVDKAEDTDDAKQYTSLYYKLPRSLQFWWANKICHLQAIKAQISLHVHLVRLGSPLIVYILNSTQWFCTKAMESWSNCLDVQSDLCLYCLYAMSFLKLHQAFMCTHTASSVFILHQAFVYSHNASYMYILSLQQALCVPIL